MSDKLCALVKKIKLAEEELKACIDRANRNESKWAKWIDPQKDKQVKKKDE